MKPLGHKNYGSIPHLRGSRMGSGDHKCDDGQYEIATKKARDWKDLIIVQEKLDGSNVGIARVGGQIIPLNRSGYKASSSPWEQHHVFNDWVYKNVTRFDGLEDGERIVGEWLHQAHGTRYDLPHEPFVAFDLMREHERTTYLEFSYRMLKFDTVIPRLIHIGQPISVKNVVKRLEPSGHGAIDEVEGAVWRIEREGKVNFLVKYVRPDKIDGKYLPEISGKKPVYNKFPQL
jgi:hypothetical protein